MSEIERSYGSFVFPSAVRVHWGVNVQRLVVPDVLEGHET
jgi:hypothetical protein